MPSARWLRTPKEMPLATRGAEPPDAIVSRMACSSRVIWRASISIKPEPNMPTVARELAMSCRVIFWRAPILPSMLCLLG